MLFDLSFFTLHLTLIKMVHVLISQHNFTDGMALGSAFLLYGSVGGWSRTLFLLAHEIPQEVGFHLSVYLIVNGILLSLVILMYDEI